MDRSGTRLLGAALLATALLASCKREERPFRVEPPYASMTDGRRLSPLQPGPVEPAAHVKNEYEENAWAMAEGKRLYTSFNCNGCHANGGGGMGPPLMDKRWIYGSAPEQIFATIMEGRPNGMPSFRGKIPDHQVWMLVAYVRSMSGLVPMDAAPGRNDNMQVGEPENSRTAERPKQSQISPSSEMPL